ncbi:lysoplasmalogenase [Sneathiella aquimaris]|uniref:lysoplasmalogenase n=1 Tax=Sneathiella aquimaris TaxID=2599305 RepID=UPI00146D00EE|nr:lysoplasmalogenase [Sneathiella aquimaris]
MLSSSSYNNAALLVTAVIFAVAYQVAPVIEGSIAFIVLKAGGCFLLALFAYSNLPPGKAQKLMTAALLASCLGDIFLAIRTSDYFIQGLGSFLVAHLLYVAVFTRYRLPAPLPKSRQMLVGATVLIGLGMIGILWAHLGNLKAPVSIYVTVIALMTLSAIYSHLPAKLLVSGAFLFMISDAMIAINKFLMPIPMAGTYIWVTYFTAQLLITLAVIKGTTERSFLLSEK